MLLLMAFCHLKNLRPGYYWT